MTSNINGLDSIVRGMNSAASMPKRGDMFKKMDANGDGVVTKDEMKTVMDQISLSSGKSIDVDKLFAEIDTNGDGKITQAESDAYEAKMAANRPSPDEMFAKADTNNDGYISKDELKASLANIPARPDGSTPDIDKLFTKIDTDGDGKISKAEFSAFHKAMGSHHKKPEQNTNASSGTVDPNDPTSTTTEILLKSLDEQNNQKQSIYQQTPASNGSLLLSEMQSTVDILC